MAEVSFGFDNPRRYILRGKGMELRQKASPHKTVRCSSADYANRNLMNMNLESARRISAEQVTCTS